MVIDVLSSFNLTLIMKVLSTQHSHKFANGCLLCCQVFVLQFQYLPELSVRNMSGGFF